VTDSVQRCRTSEPGPGRRNDQGEDPFCRLLIELRRHPVTPPSAIGTSSHRRPCGGVELASMGTTERTSPSPRLRGGSDQPAPWRGGCEWSAAISGAGCIEDVGSPSRVLSRDTFGRAGSAVTRGRGPTVDRGHRPAELKEEGSGLLVGGLLETRGVVRPARKHGQSNEAEAPCLRNVREQRWQCRSPWRELCLARA